MAQKQALCTETLLGGLHQFLTRGLALRASFVRVISLGSQQPRVTTYGGLIRTVKKNIPQHGEYVRWCSLAKHLRVHLQKRPVRQASESSPSCSVSGVLKNRAWPNCNALFTSKGD